MPKLLECDGSCGDYACTIEKTVTDEEAAQLKQLGEDHGIDVEFADGVWWTLQTMRAPCAFYKEGKCSIHEQRPLVCKTWFCKKCGGTQEERRARAREIFLRERNAENGWVRFEAP